MPGYIVQFGGKYCAWSTVKGAPTTRLMTEAELFAALARDHPYLEREIFDCRMARVREYGCSGGMYGFTKADLLASNRAGPDGSHVATEEEMIALYLYGAPKENP
ncbi:hypothetical protein B0G69_6506 [Paraburkholderia sp. RAU2J]|uniref:hypothetical protein n=1 Tax=Paraburkholderia sp. RAU2J TaxID=1938810 RepID=UPI000EAF00FE|nr:hypothetical protein [Paraburkholderia sp. RAU2J]RKT13365.1 hypothetical protein B0G69_6506 [Paraburkholderia sp. RAU2J]